MREMRERRERRGRVRQEVKAEEELPTFDEGYPAIIVEVLGRTGSRGEVQQVRCKVLAGKDKGKVLRRNIIGPIRVNDVLMLKETVLEATSLTAKRR